MSPGPARFRSQMLALRATPPVLAAFALLITGSLSQRTQAPDSESNDHATYDGSLSQAAQAPDIAAGIPPLHFRDADPWPHGMVIAPRVADNMAVAPAVTPDASDWPHGIAIGRRDTVLSALFGPLAAALTAPAPALL